MPTASDPVSPAALIDTVAVEPAKPQVVAAATGGGVERSSRPVVSAAANASPRPGNRRSIGIPLTKLVPCTVAEVSADGVRAKPLRGGSRLAGTAVSSITSFALTVGFFDWRFVPLEIVHTYQR